MTDDEDVADVCLLMMTVTCFRKPCGPRDARRGRRRSRRLRHFSSFWTQVSHWWGTTPYTQNSRKKT